MWPLNATPLDRSAGELDNDTYEHLAWAKAFRSQIVEADGPRTIENTLVPYNEILMHVDAARAECGLFARGHPSARVRRSAADGVRAVARYTTELSLDRPLYDAFATLNVSRTDAATQYAVDKILRDFRRAGVDRPVEVRGQVAELRAEIVKLELAFRRNVRNDDRVILLDSRASLKGLPKDWIDRHPPGLDGKIRVTTRDPDYIPFMMYAHNAEVRSRLHRESVSRGCPENTEVLHELLGKRYELARLLGYPNWAEYATEGTMIGNAESVQALIDRIANVSRRPAGREYDALLQRKQRDAPGASKLEEWERKYYRRVIQGERFNLDPRSVREYFNFPDVMRGLFELTGKMFGIDYRRAHGLNLWHEDVTAWDVYDGKKRIGRFYLDPYVRDAKPAHAASFSYRTGVAGVRLPQVVLVCDFPNPRRSKDGTALMEHAEVVTLFHEFGQVLHAISAGHRRWMVNAGFPMESDFVEAPAYLLEEWCYDPDALPVFARHHRTGEPIPHELVELLRRNRAFGKGLSVAQQAFYASVTLNYHNRDPKGLDATGLFLELQEIYSPFDYVEETHFECSFGQLGSHSACCDSHLWSRVIAKDLSSEFERRGLLDPKTARRYRKTILEAGGSETAAEMIEDFLGRPCSFDAFESWLSRD